jgi:hypothetical protein
MTGGICGHLASAFGNLVSMPIAALGLSGHCNGYRATVAVIYNNPAITALAVIIAPVMFSQPHSQPEPHS